MRRHGKQRRRLLTGAILLGTVALSLVSAEPARAARSSTDLLHTQVVRVHARLTREALESPEIAEAHASVARAFASYYQIRENILIDLRTQQDYTDLRLALWHQQQILAGQHQQVPVRIANILATARDTLELRTRINKMEADALEASPEYMAARDELNSLVAAERQVMAEAIDRVRSDPEFISVTQQLRTVLQSYRPRSRK